VWLGDEVVIELLVDVVAVSVDWVFVALVCWYGVVVWLFFDVVGYCCVMLLVLMVRSFAAVGWLEESCELFVEVFVLLLEEVMEVWLVLVGVCVGIEYVLGHYVDVWRWLLVAFDEVLDD